MKPNLDYISSRAAASNDFGMVPEFVSFKDGILKVKVNIKGIAATEEKISVFALNVEKEMVKMLLLIMLQYSRKI